jgi:hypothetical protein
MWIAPWCKRTDSSLCIACRRARKNPIIPNPKVAKVSAVRIHAKVVRSIRDLPAVLFQKRSQVSPMAEF